MKNSINCNLYVLGDLGVGKSTLIWNLQMLNDYFDDFNLKHQNINWVIRENDFEANVWIEEGFDIELGLLEIISWNFQNETIVILMVNSEEELKNIFSGNYWNIIESALSEIIIIVLISLKEKKRLDESGFNYLKSKYDFIRDILFIDSFVDKNLNQIGEFRIMVKKIILNAFTDRLGRVKEKIKLNLENEEKTLDIGKSNITNLLEVREVFQNIHLETLILSNEWGEYDYEFKNWTRKISSNSDAENVLSVLPKEMSNFKNLKKLICGGNWRSGRRDMGINMQWRIENISVISKLTKLSILNLSNNRINEVGELGSLKNLEKLYLNNNNISIFPDISELNMLSDIYISNNKLKDINSLKNLKNLNSLDLHSNRITNLIPIRGLISEIGIFNTKWEVGSISVSQNPLIVPTQEIIIQGKNKILAYFRQYEAEQKVNLKPYVNKDIKLVLVGNSNSGKSTLVHWLKFQNIEKGISTTHWMNIENWHVNNKGEEFTVRIFDFGGQEYYHDTHHLFFSNKTAYVVLWEQKSNLFEEIEVDQKQIDGTFNLTKIQSFPLEYWLESINFHLKRKKTYSEKEVEELLIKRSLEIGKSDGPKDEDYREFANRTEEGCNILVIQNKADSWNDKSFVNQKMLKNDYGKIFDFASISVLEEKGLANLRDLLFDIFKSISIIGEEYLGTWGVIKRKIEGSDFNHPFALQEFLDYCNDTIRLLPELQGKNKESVEETLFNLQDAESFAQYLNDIGVLLYFPENINIKDKIFLNQRQVLDNIYKVLLGLENTNGEFGVVKILKSLNKKDWDNEVENTLNLMIHFKIVFEHPVKKRTFIAPLYLPKEPAQSLKIFIPLFSKPDYRFQYKNFIHKNVILDFFHYYGKQTLKESNIADLFYYWREGIVVKDEISDEIVMVHFVMGNGNDQKAHIDVFSITKTANNYFLNKIIEDLDNINEDWDTLKMVSANGLDFIPLDIIHENEKIGNWVFQYNSISYKLSDFTVHLKNSIRMKKIFISYSKQDLALVNKFLEHLSSLQIDGLVSHWYCTELSAGSNWNTEIKEHFEEADIICFMISPNFMKTKYIHEHEIAMAFDKKEREPEFRIVPIILDFCRWTTKSNNLSQFTALPYTAKPVVDFNNQNMAWYIILECLRLIIDENLNPMGDDFYSEQQLPSDILKLFERIIEGSVNKN